MSNERYRIACDHALTRLQSQREDIAHIRNRASITAAISGLIATFFATTIGPDTLALSMSGETAFGFSLPAMLVMVCFASSIAMSGVVVANGQDFTFSFDTAKMIDFCKSESETAFFSRYANDGEWYFRENEVAISKAQSQLFWATVFGWVQIVPWLLLM